MQNLIDGYNFNEEMEGREDLSIDDEAPEKSAPKWKELVTCINDDVVNHSLVRFAMIRKGEANR